MFSSQKVHVMSITGYFAQKNYGGVFSESYERKK
jgi:hypothetical protein